MIEPYQVVVTQTAVREVRPGPASKQTIRDNIWHQIVLFRRFQFSYGRVRLIVLSELATHALHVSGSREAQRAVAMHCPMDRPLWEVDGAEELAMYALAAREFDVYVAASGWVQDPAFPDPFHSTFVISPEGKCILLQRTHNCGLGGASVIGYYSQIVKEYGDDGPLSPIPVVDTEIGKLGVCLGGDHTQEETCRALAMRGAEVIIHQMGERNREMTPYRLAMKRKAAADNMCYFLGANLGQYFHANYRQPAPANGDALAQMKAAQNWAEFEFKGTSLIIDYRGAMLAYIPAAGESATGAVIDVERLRADRLRKAWQPAMHSEAYAREYDSVVGAALDWETGSISRRDMSAATIRRLMDEGRVIRSQAYGGEAGGGGFGELPTHPAQKVRSA